MRTPWLAAQLFFTIGPQWALLFNTLSYAFSWAVIRSTHLAPQKPPATATTKPGLRAEFLAGLRFFAGNRALLSLLIIAAIVEFGSSTIISLNVFFITENLHADASLYGTISTAFAIGAIVGALCAIQLAHRIGVHTATWWSLLATGLLVCAYSRQTSPLWGIALLATSAVTVTIYQSVSSTMIVGTVRQEYLGRTMAIFYPVVSLAAMIPAMGSSWLASTG